MYTVVEVNPRIQSTAIDSTTTGEFIKPVKDIPGAPSSGDQKDCTMSPTGHLLCKAKIPILVGTADPPNTQKEISERQPNGEIKKDAPNEGTEEILRRTNYMKWR